MEVLKTAADRFANVADNYGCGISAGAGRPTGQGYGRGSGAVAGSMTYGGDAGLVMGLGAAGMTVQAMGVVAVMTARLRPFVVKGYIKLTASSHLLTAYLGTPPRGEFCEMISRRKFATSSSRADFSPTGKRSARRWMRCGTSCLGICRRKRELPSSSRRMSGESNTPRQITTTGITS